VTKCQSSAYSTELSKYELPHSIGYNVARIKRSPYVRSSVPTVSSIALGGLQVVALLAAVVVAGSRLLISGLEPSSGREDTNNWLAKVIAYGAIGSLIALSGAAILFILGLMSAYGMPPLVDLAFLLLLGGLTAFGVPMALLVYYKWQQDKLPSPEPPR